MMMIRMIRMMMMVMVIVTMVRMIRMMMMVRMRMGGMRRTTTIFDARATKEEGAQILNKTKKKL